MQFNVTESKIAVIGLGYVGLPLAVAFAKKYAVIGFDINQSRIDALHKGIDHTLEIDEEELTSVNVPEPGSIGFYATAQLNAI